MAFNPSPDTWLGAGYSYAANAITLDTAAGSNPLLTQLTAAEANDTTGDIREVVFALMETLYLKYQAIASADRPTKMVISRSVNVNGDGTLTNVYTVNITSSILTQGVTPEP